MRIFRNFPEFRNFPDLRGHSRGNPRSGLIFMGGGGGVPYIVFARWPSAMLERHNLYTHYQPILSTESSQVSSVCFTSTCTSRPIT